MKVLIVTNQFPAISTPFILNLVTGLIDLHVKVTVVSLEQADESNQHKTYYDYKPAFQRIEKPPVPRSWYKRLLYFFASLGYFLARNPVMLFLCLKAVFRGRYGLSLRYIYDIRFYYDLRAFDLAHAQFGPIGAELISLKLDKVFDYPVITHFRGYDIQRIFKYRPENLYQQLFRSGDYFIANCEYFRKKIIEMGAPSDKTVVLYSGIDDHFFKKTSQPGKNTGNSIELVSVGRLTGKKGLEFTLKAISLCRELRPHTQFRFSIIGDGEIRNELERLVNELGLQKEVQFLGSRNHSFILDFLQTQDIFLSHNIKTADGDEDAPVNVIKEAYLLKLPVVSTWHGGIPELVQHGICGLLVQEKDIAGMADAILQLANSPDLRRKFGEAGCQIVKDRFTNSIINRQLLAIYSRVLNTIE